MTQEQQSSGISDHYGAPAPGPGGQRSTWLSLGFFVFTATAMAADVVFDLWAASAPGHVVLEAAISGFALLGALWFWRRLVRERAAGRRMRAQLATARRASAQARLESQRWCEEADRWRKETRELLSGLGAAIEAQFKRWSLTGAEREVALLLLKGLALKEVAAARGVSERTVRQQALGVYRKAELGGRAELSAFFLEDLLAPRSAPADHDLAAPEG